MSALVRHNRIKTLAKIGVSLGLVGYLIWLIDWNRAIETMRQADKVLVLVAPVCLWLGFGLSAFRWQLVLADNRVSFSYWQAVKGYLLGAFYSIFLPGVIGGDAIRIGLCARRTKCSVSVATASVLLERMSGVLALLGFLFGVQLFFPGISASLLAIESTSLIMGLAVVGVAAIAVLLLGRRVWIRWLPLADRGRVWAFIRSSAQTLADLRGQTGWTVLVLSALFQMMDILATFLLARAIGISLPLSVFFAVNPMVYLVTVLPISLGGLGVREGTFVFLLSRFGVLTSDAITLSFLVYMNRVVAGSMGGIIQLVETVSGTRANETVEKLSLPKEKWSH